MGFKHVRLLLAHLARVLNGILKFQLTRRWFCGYYPMRKRRFRHRAPKLLLFPSSLLPKVVPSPPFSIPNRSLPFDSAPRMPQAPILTIFHRFPGQKGTPHGSLFGRFPYIFVYFLKKRDLSKTCTGMIGLHVRPSQGAPFSSNLSSKSSI